MHLFSAATKQYINPLVVSGGETLCLIQFDSMWTHRRIPRKLQIQEANNVFGWTVGHEKKEIGISRPTFHI